jgi:hypothetical protein
LRVWACQINLQKTAMHVTSMTISLGFGLIDLIASKSTETPKPSKEHAMGDSLP